MTTFYIFRHGETFATKENVHYGLKIWHATILPEAKPVIERLGMYLKNKKSDFQASSEFLRCKETTKIVSDITGKPFITDKRLNEFVFETFGGFRRRTQSFLDEVNRKQYRTVMICTHGAVIAGLVNLLTEGKFEWHDIKEYPAPGILIEIKGEKMQQISFRDEMTIT